MTREDVDVVRTDPQTGIDLGRDGDSDGDGGRDGDSNRDAFEIALRDLLVDYYEEVDGQVRRHFPDRLPPLDVEDAVAADLDRLRTAAIDRPLLVAVRDGAGGDAAVRVGARNVGVRSEGTGSAGVESGSPILVGTVQLKRIDATTAEVKRLYVVPSHRGDGIGRALMEALLEEAGSEGLETLRLGVAPYHERARALYADLGFEFTAQYAASQTPAPLVDDWGFMRYILSD